MNTSQGIWKAIKTPAFMGVIIPLPCLRVQPQLQWASRLSGGLTRGGRLSANAGELGEPNRTTSRYARAVHTSQNEFAIQPNTYSEKCLDNGTLFSFLPQACNNIWNDTLTKRLEFQLWFEAIQPHQMNRQWKFLTVLWLLKSWARRNQQTVDISSPRFCFQAI